MQTGKPVVTIEDYLSFRSKVVADKVRSRRMEIGLSQVDIAKAIGCSRPRVARIEKGENSYSQAELELLSIFLEMDRLELCGIDNQEWLLLQKVYSNAESSGLLKDVVVCDKGPLKEGISYGVFDLGTPMAFSHDGTKIAAIIYDAQQSRGSLCVWDTSTGELVALKKDVHQTAALCFDPGGLEIAFTRAVCENALIEIWDYRKDVITKTFEFGKGNSIPFPVPSSGSAKDKAAISMMVWSPDGKYLVSYDMEREGVIEWWNCQSGDCERSLALPSICTVSDIKVKSDHEETGEQVTDMGFWPGGAALAIRLFERGGIFFVDSATGMISFVDNHEPQGYVPAFIPVKPESADLCSMCVAFGLATDRDFVNVSLMLRSSSGRIHIGTTFSEKFPGLYLSNVRAIPCGNVIGLVSCGNSLVVLNLVTHKSFVLDIPQSKSKSKLLLSPDGRVLALQMSGEMLFYHLDIERLSSRSPSGEHANVSIQEMIKTVREEFENPLPRFRRGPSGDR